MAFIGAGLGTAVRSLPFSSARASTSKCIRTSMTLATGTRIPLDKEAMVIGDSGPKGISLESVFKGKKVVMFTIPGALTPTCTDSHAPAFIDALGKLKEKGVEDVVCLSVNDPFVMDAYAKKLEAKGKITFLADGDASISKALGVEFDTGGFGGIRAKRGSFIVDDGVFTQVNLEDGGGYTGPSKVDTVLEQL